MKIFEKDNLSILKEIGRKGLVKRFITFIVGLLLISISYNLFLEPNHLVPGGVTGIAIIINNYIAINSSLIILICNLVLLLVSLILLGKEKTLATFIY